VANAKVVNQINKHAVGQERPLKATSAIDPNQIGDCKSNPIKIKIEATAGVNRSGNA